MTLGVTAQPTGARGVDRAELAKRLAAGGVPIRFADCRFMSFSARPGTKAALEAAIALGDDQDARGLVLFGAPGTGKTHLAVAIIARRLEGWLARWPEEAREEGGRILVRPNLDARFLVVPSFLDRLRAAVRYQAYDDPLPDLFSAELVVLDDLGREKVTDWATERLYVLVNERYNRCLPTVVTSNYSPDELVGRGYEALVSRLTEGAQIVEIAADDYRRGRH